MLIKGVDGEWGWSVGMESGDEDDGKVEGESENFVEW